jgi:hypothetical protein
VSNSHLCLISTKAEDAVLTFVVKNSLLRSKQTAVLAFAVESCLLGCKQIAKYLLLAPRPSFSELVQTGYIPIHVILRRTIKCVEPHFWTTLD